MSRVWKGVWTKEPLDQAHQDCPWGTEGLQVSVEGILDKRKTWQAIYKETYCRLNANNCSELSNKMYISSQQID